MKRIKSGFVVYYGIILIGITYFQCTSSSEEISYLYLSQSGSDQNDASINTPVKTLSRAFEIIKNSGPNEDISKVVIYLQEGIYNLEETLVIDGNVNSNLNKSIEIRAMPDQRVVLSGGMSLEASWVKKTETPNGIIWSYKIPDDSPWVVRQLFHEGRRVQRASSPYFKTEGPLNKYADKIKRFDFVGVRTLKNEELEAFSAFKYMEDDLNGITDLHNAEMIVHHSWESSWHEIVRVDNNSKEVYLSNPFRYPVGFFNSNESYRIENSTAFFDSPESWMYDKDKKELLYYANSKEDPNELDFVVPILQTLIRFNGKENDKVRNISFHDLEFSYTDYPLGINEIETDIRRRMSKQYSWLDFSKGFSASQTAPNSGEAILIEYGENIGFYNCSFSHLGAYAINIGEGSKQNSVEGCKIFDTGAGGISIGLVRRNVNQNRTSISTVPGENEILNNTIFDCGKVHPSGVGIAIYQSYNNRISNNSIYNLPYSGISLGWTWDNSFNYTKGNIISENVIHDVMQLLADGAGIYTLGDLEGSVIEGNHIYNVKRSGHAVGASVNGIFFDQATQSLRVSNNIVEKIDGLLYKFNKTDSLNIEFVNNHFIAE